MLRLGKDFVQDLRKEFHGYGTQPLRKDVLAGITVAAVALPLALAFGVGSGADAAAGLITAIVSAFVIGTLSGASFQISGPTGAMTAILVPLAARHGLQALFAASLLAGVFLILAGLLRIGKLVYFLPSPVIAGFTSGIALIIALGQVGNFLGVQMKGENALAQVVGLFRSGFVPNGFAIGTALFVIILMVVWPAKWGARVPGSLAAVILATAATALLDLPVATVGSIPQTLIHGTRLTVGSLFDMHIETILLPAVSIAALCTIESLLCGAAGGRMKGERMNADRELVAQGIGNLILPFLGGVPATAAIARSSVAIKSGGQTRLTGIIQGVVLLLSMFLLSPFMSRIPMAALAGVLMVTAWRMNEWHSIRYLFGHKFKGAITKFIITMLTTVLFDLTIAIAAGVLFAIALFVVQISTLQVAVTPVDPERLELQSKVRRNMQVIYITGAVFFGSLEQMESGLSKADGEVLILSMRGVPFIDTSAVSFLLDFCESRKKQGITIVFSSIQPSVKSMLDRGGVSEVVGHEAYFFNAKDAILTHLD